MKVTLMESGGWANIVRSCTIDTASLPRPVALQLERDCVSVLEAVTVPGNGAARDARNFTLEVVSDGEARRASFTETAAPPELRSILAVLRPWYRIVPAGRI